MVLVYNGTYGHGLTVVSAHGFSMERAIKASSWACVGGSYVLNEKLLIIKSSYFNGDVSCLSKLKSRVQSLS